MHINITGDLRVASLTIRSSFTFSKKASTDAIRTSLDSGWQPSQNCISRASLSSWKPRYCTKRSGPEATLDHSDS